MEADAAVNAGRKVNPVPIRAFAVFARTGVNAGDGTGIDTIGNTFAGLGHNRVGQGSTLLKIDRFLDHTPFF